MSNHASLPAAQFISLEGTEGVGKTTLIQSLTDWLSAQGISVLQTREPGGSAFAETLRQLLLDPAVSMADDSELLLMFSARADHLATTIIPALQQGKWVLCDRFIDSSIAYQGFGRHHGDPNALQKIQMLIDGFVPKRPDMTFWLDLPILEGMERAKKRGKLDRFEQEQAAFFERVYQGFVYQAGHNPERIRRVDASKNAEQVLSDVIAMLGLGT